MKNEDLLKAALENYGCESIKVSETVDSVVGDTRVIFERNERGIFDAVFKGRIPNEQASAFLVELDEEYVHLVQEQTYQNLLLRAKERGLVMESEQVQEDNSVMITFRV